MNINAVVTIIDDDNYSKLIDNLNAYHGHAFPLQKKGQIYKIVNRELCIVRAADNWSTGDLLGFLMKGMVLSNQVSLYCIPIDSLFCIPMNQGCEGRNIRHNNTYLDVDLEPLPPRHSKLNIYAEPLEIFGGLISCIPEPLHEPLIKEHNGNIVFRVKDCDIISLYPRSNETHWPFDLKLAQEQQAEWVRRLDEVGVIAKQNGSMMKMSITLKQLQEHPDLLKKLLYACLDNAGVDFQALEDICLF